MVLSGTFPLLHLLESINLSNLHSLTVWIASPHHSIINIKNVKVSEFLSSVESAKYDQFSENTITQSNQIMMENEKNKKTG